MTPEEARERLQNALASIEARIKSAEARPTREEIESLREARTSDLEEIIELREKINSILKE